MGLHVTTKKVATTVYAWMVTLATTAKLVGLMISIHNAYIIVMFIILIRLISAR